MWEEIKTKVERCRSIRLYPTIKTLLVNVLGQISWKSGFNICLKFEKIEKRNFIRFIYNTYDEQGNIVDQYNYPVRLTRTRCNIAGWRYWFACPILKANEKPCHRRVSVLYKPPARKCFGCRHCHNLIYESQCLSGKDKLFGKIIPLPTIDEEEEVFKRKVYCGLPTRKYSAFAHKKVKNYFRIQKHGNALREQLVCK